MTDTFTPRITPSGAIEHFINSKFQHKLAYLLVDATSTLEAWDRDEVIDRATRFIESRNGKPADPFISRVEKLRRR